MLFFFARRPTLASQFQEFRRARAVVMILTSAVARSTLQCLASARTGRSASARALRFSPCVSVVPKVNPSLGLCESSSCKTLISTITISWLVRSRSTVFLNISRVSQWERDDATLQSRLVAIFRVFSRRSSRTMRDVRRIVDILRDTVRWKHRDRACRVNLRTANDYFPKTRRGDDVTRWREGARRHEVGAKLCCGSLQIVHPRARARAQFVPRSCPWVWVNGRSLCAPRRQVISRGFSIDLRPRVKPETVESTARLPTFRQSVSKLIHYTRATGLYPQLYSSRLRVK